MALDRTWYNTLHNDTGTGLDGSIWAKEDVDALMDAVDAELNRIDIALADPTIARTNKTNYFATAQVVQGLLYLQPSAGDIAARLSFYDRDQPANARYWEIHAHAQTLRFWALNDDQTGGAVGPTLVLNRAGGASVAADFRTGSWIYERSRSVPIGYPVAWTPTLQNSAGTGLGFAAAPCVFSRVGMLLTARIYIALATVVGPTQFLLISQPTEGGAPYQPSNDQEIIRLHYNGADEPALLIANAGYWQLARMSGQPFANGATVWIIGTSHYWTAQA